MMHALPVQSSALSPVVEQSNAPHGQTPSRRLPSIIEVIQTVQQVKEAYRPLTQQERELLLSWPGWGPYASAFEVQPAEKWATTGPQIRELLGADGYEAASAATPTSYFTSPYISQAIWRVVEQLGFSGGAVLEPGCGTGQLFSQAPEAWNLQVTGVEMEPFTANVAQLLWPQAHIINAPLQEVALLNDAYDLVVGNVPFANVAIYDRSLPFKERLSLHNYCIYRALQALRPGGIAVLISSRYTMDAKDMRAREELAKLGMLLGAIRLPSHGHKWARTAVITDLLVFQRRYARASWEGHHWIPTATLALPEGEEVAVNTYFAEQPRMILGTPTLDRGMYYGHELVIKAPEDLEKAVDAAVGQIAAEAARHKSTYVPPVDRTQLDRQQVVLREDGLKEGCFYLLNQGLIEIVHGQPKAVTKMVAELSALVRLRDAGVALLEAERDHSTSDEALAPLRATLNRRYDAYAEKYGPIRRSTLIKRIDKATGEERISRRLPAAMYAFRTDEHYPLVLSLEIYDDETGQAKKAAIFSQRVNRPAVYKETAESPEEAIALSLDRHGRLDFAFLAQATGIPEEQIAGYLGDLAYEDPATGTWEIAPLYLSGNVRQKLVAAQQALRGDRKWQRNVEALERVQPEPIPPEDIKVLLGAPWIPINYIVQFCEQTFKIKPAIARDRLSGSWHVAPPLGVKFSAEATSTWGTQRVSAFRLVEHLLNHKTTTVEDVDRDGHAHVNTEETMLAQQKRQEIQARFGEWIWEDNERTKALAALYNQLYNGVVATTFNGNHLSFPGMDATWQQNLYPWQRDFIARMINSRSALCAFPVGAGKTKIQVAGAMTLRRMGLITKAAIVVPNHLLEQIASEAKQLYLGADILMISRDDLAQERRRIFMARIATGDHDLIIMTHSAFEAIGVHPDTKRAYIQERLKEYKQVLYSLDQKSEDKAEKRKIKQLEKQLQRMREHLKALLDTPHDGGITFEQLGISYLVVDEAHFFKNLGLPTNQEKLTVTSSQRAQDMLMKLRWLEQHNGGRPFASFFTATPISNSMAEAYVMLWYLAHAQLEDYELYTLDDFASMFIETESKIEVTPNGAGFRMYERPANFVNLPEFMHLFGSVADIRSPDILADKRPDRLEHTIAVEPTEEVMAFVDELVERSEKLRAGQPLKIGGKDDNMLWVTTDGRKAALWLGLHGRREAYPAKLDAIATQMAKVFHRWQEKAIYLPGPYKSLQIGFCDMGTPSKERGEQVYGELKRLLVEKGLPAKGIRYIHEAGESDQAKAALFEQCRTGEVAILLGSTAKLGTGTNIQTRCAAIHHCDAPWRPDEVEQREGRGQRPGNLYPVVEIFYYVQRRTFDAYSWQILANKAKFFNQLRSSTVISREIAYSDDSSLTYGQVKAAATGDILLLEHANVSLSTESFSRLHASFTRARERDKQEAKLLYREASQYEQSLKRYQQMAQRVAQYTAPHPFLTPERSLLAKKEAQRDFVASEIMRAVKAQARTHKLGYWQGVPVFFVLDRKSDHQYTLAFDDPYEGIKVSCSAQWLEPDHHWRWLWKIEQCFAALSTQVEEYTATVEHKRRAAAEFEQQAQTPFPHQQAWQSALSRKQALDHYIAVAASAHTDEELQQLAELRHTLLATAPQELTERPKPKNTASFVLPPRHPNQEATESAQKIELSEPVAQEQTIADVARTIQRSVIGSKATVAFGNPEHIQLSRQRRRKASKKPVPQVSLDWPAVGASNDQPSPQPTLWSGHHEEPPSQLSLW